MRVVLEYMVEHNKLVMFQSMAWEERNSGTRKYENCTVLTLFYLGAFPRGLAKNKGTILRNMSS